MKGTEEKNGRGGEVEVERGWGAEEYGLWWSGSGVFVINNNFLRVPEKSFFS